LGINQHAEARCPLFAWHGGRFPRKGRVRAGLGRLCAQDCPPMEF
jgi:hypothetical protein